ncbi:MAG: hypothetical protein ACK5BY_08995 [Limnohabitans sp.]|uniref:hypothetical protein n=1 Tax=Limnohabitans sp. TaxID=1907725 RepID=UPI00391C0C5D
MPITGAAAQDMAAALALWLAHIVARLAGMPGHFGGAVGLPLAACSADCASGFGLGASPSRMIPPALKLASPNLSALSAWLNCCLRRSDDPAAQP